MPRALAAAGAVGAGPDVPEWRALRLAPDVTPSSVRASLVALAEHAGKVTLWDCEWEEIPAARPARDAIHHISRRIKES